MAAENPADFPGAVRELVAGPTEWVKLNTFADMIRDEGELRGLIGPRELPRLWSRHLINSLALTNFIPQGADVCDVGSGAGFPGLVLAISRPDLEVTLVEPMERRVNWLHDAISATGVGNVQVIRGRAEEVAGGLEFSIVTARAVAALDKLLRWTWPLVAPGGAVLAMKGERAQEEVDSALKVLRKFKVSAEVHSVESPLDGTRTNIVEVR